MGYFKDLRHVHGPNTVVIKTPLFLFLIRLNFCCRLEEILNMEKSKNQKLLSRNTELEEILAVSGKNEMCMCKMFGFQMVTVHASNFFLRVALTGPRHVAM